MSTENTAVGQVKKDISAQVLAKIDAFQKSGELTLPKDYNVENALKSAYLILSETKNKEGKLALEHCSQMSIANALLKMCVWGLSPMKKQCYFIMYGNTLQCTPDYTGNIALAKRYAGMVEIKSNAIHQGDVFEFEIDVNTGRKRVLKHKQTLESIGSKNILGAYAIYQMSDGNFDTEIMNIEQIKDAWNQGQMKGGSPAHKNFPDRMARKTVINRACDALIRSSDDKVLYDSEDEKEVIDITHADVQHEIGQNANKKELVFEDAEVVESNTVSNIEVQSEEIKFEEPNYGPGF